MLLTGKMSYDELEQMIYHLKKEVEGSYLKNIYHYQGRWLLKFNHFSFVFEPGLAIWPGTFDERETNLHSISIKIRKEIKDHKVVSIDIVNNDRTIVITTYNNKLILELYAKGNLILTDSENKIIVLTRIYPECSHGKEYTINQFKNYDDFVSKNYYLKSSKEIAIHDNDIKDESIGNILLAMSKLWEIKYKKSSDNKLTKSKKKNKKNNPIDGINNQINKFNSKIDSKLKQLETLETFDSSTEYDFETIGKLHQERKAIAKKLEGAKVIREEKIQQSKREEQSNIKKEKKEEKISLYTNNWFQKYHWWYTKNGILVVGGRSSTDNEKLVKSYMGDNDLYFHTDDPGSGSFIMFTSNLKDFDSNKNNYMIDIDETAEGVLAFSNQWNTSCPTGEVFYVKGSQVTKSAPSGEYVGKGSFMIYGKKEFVKVTGATLGYGIYKENEKHLLMLAPYRIISRLKNFGSLRLKPRNDIKKMKGKIISTALKKKLNIELSDDLYIFNKPCNVA